MQKSNANRSGKNFEGVLYAHVDAHRTADHPELAEELFSQRGLKHYYDSYMSFHENVNQSAYHATAHSLQTALNAFEGALYSGADSKEIRALMVAGLYHDANHTQGQYTDRVNIDNALNVFRHMHASAPKHQRLSEDEHLMAKEIIQATQYPYQKKTGVLTHKVIRDADMMAAYTQDKELRLKLFLGLYEEMKVPRCSTYRLGEFCTDRLSFASLLIWNTQWAKLKALKLNWPLANRQLVEDLRNSEPHAFQRR